MKRAIQISSFVLGLLILAAPATNMIAPWLVERPLAGAVAPVKRPVPGITAVRAETFQRGFTAWFEQGYGLRATATRLDNSVGFYVFQETRPEKPVKVGRHNVLFLDEQVASWNTRADERAGSEAFARLAKIAQDGLAARGKAMVVMALPAKPPFYPGSFPESYSLPLGAQRPSEVLGYSPYIEALRRHGVDVVDGRALAERFRATPELVYSPQGRHINKPFVCIVLDEAFALARARLPGVSIPVLDCRFREYMPGNIDPEEFDLLRVMNVWGTKAYVQVTEMVTVEETVPLAQRPPTLLVGSSFSWGMMTEAERNHALGRMHLFYYNTTVVDPGDETQAATMYPVPRAGTEAWQRLVMEKTLFLFPVPPEYIPVHNSDFLMQLVDALGLDPGELRAIFAPWAPK
jgi:SGNH hydrolase-like domain, acetyltransferase AlgX